MPSECMTMNHLVPSLNTYDHLSILIYLNYEIIIQLFEIITQNLMIVEKLLYLSCLLSYNLIDGHSREMYYLSLIGE